MREVVVCAIKLVGLEGPLGGRIEADRVVEHVWGKSTILSGVSVKRG